MIMQLPCATIIFSLILYSLPEKSELPDGDERDFYVLNVGSNAYVRIKAVLYYITDHLYFWIQEGVKFDLADVQQLSETFENQIYPRNREFFGSENTPGIDNDEHLYILYTERWVGRGLFFLGRYQPAGDRSIF